MKRGKRGRGNSNKVPVVGIVERGGRIVAKPMDKSRLKYRHLGKFIRDHVKCSDAVMITDEYQGYFRVRTFMAHQTINHKFRYVDGEIHTNTIEGFWGLLKRGIMGQYHKVTLRHLHQYITEFCYRYNHRKNPALFDLTLARAVGA